MLSDDWLVDEFEAMDLSRSCLQDAKESFHLEFPGIGHL